MFVVRGSHGLQSTSPRPPSKSSSGLGTEILPPENVPWTVQSKLAPFLPVRASYYRTQVPFPEHPTSPYRQ
jgi:hypothetical protein